MDLPMSQDVIDRVHMFARRSHANRKLLFAWRDGAPITDDDDDASNTDYNLASDDKDIASDEEDDNTDDDESSTNNQPNDGNDEYPLDALDMPITGVVEDKNENKIKDEDARPGPDCSLLPFCDCPKLVYALQVIQIPFLIAFCLH
jgi:hypothetical protein